jgi:hypothetical protein
MKIVYDSASPIFGNDGKTRTRLMLNDTIKIAARTWFISLATFFDRLISWTFGTKRTWVPIRVGSNTVLLNVESIAKRTILSHKQILDATPAQLLEILSKPETISYEPGKLNNGLLPHVYFINLAKRTDRKEIFEKHLRFIGANLKYEQQDAVVGAALPKDEICKMSKSASAIKNKKDDRAGRLGCFKSHLAAVEKAKEQNLPEILILEDDVRFIPCYFTSNYARQARKELPDTWGICFLGHYDAGKSTPYSEHLVKPGCPYDCHAYLVKNDMYDTLIAALKAELEKPEIRALDVVIGEDLVKTGRIYACKDNIAIQDEGFSSIVGKVVQGNYVKELRKFRHTLY